MFSRREFLKDLATASAAVPLCQSRETDASITPDVKGSMAAYFQPTTLNEALSVRSHFHDQIVPISGGTIVGRDIRFGEYELKRLLDLSRIPELSLIKLDNDRVEIGAATTFSVLETAQTSEALRQAAKGVGGPAIRHKATLGGNLVAARFDGDGCVAALATPTVLELVSSTRGSRAISIDEFFGTEEKVTTLRPDELLTKIAIPRNWDTAWSELGKREGASHSVVCCAVGISDSGAVRIAFGGAGRTVLRSSAAEDVIKRSGLNVAAIEKASLAAVADVRPESDFRASSDYRRHMCGVMVTRTLTTLLQRRRGE